MYCFCFQAVNETDGPVKSKEQQVEQQAEKIYATLRECREQCGIKKNKGMEIFLLTVNIVLLHFKAAV